MAAALLDQVNRGKGGSTGQAADLLWGAGSAGGVAAAGSGLADWEDKFGAERDLATAHGLLNSAALLLIATSLVVRRRGPASRGGRALPGRLGAGRRRCLRRRRPGLSARPPGQSQRLH
jgi:hypothetical protein